MAFVDDALKDKPMAIYALDDTSPFQDYSGYNRSAVQVGGTPTTHAAIVSGTQYAPIFTSAIRGQFASPVFIKGRERASFSLEAWTKVIDGTGEQQVLGNTGVLDGLLIQGNIVSFVIKFASAPEARVSFDIQQKRVVHLVGVYTSDKISLFVNAELVGDLSLSEEQKTSEFSMADSNLHSGFTVGTQKIAVSSVAVYAGALAPESITRHFVVGTNLMTGLDAASGFGGQLMPVSLANANLFLDQWWTTEAQWQAGTLFNVAVTNSQLRPQFEGDTSIPGRWMASFALDAAEGTSVHGVSANWDGKGFTIEVSLDGTTWQAVNRGVNIGLIPPGFNPTDKDLQIRVSFSGGVVNDDSFLDNLNFVGLSSGVSPAVNGRTITMTNAFQERDYRPLEFHDNWGVEIGAGGSVVISPDTTDEALPIRTVELWFKPNATGAFAPGNAASAVYQNGVANAGNLRANEWTVVHRVLTANQTTAFTINTPGQLGQVILYPTALTAAQVAKIYAQYVGTSVTRVNDVAGIQIIQTSPSARIYGFDWSIQAAG